MSPFSIEDGKVELAPKQSLSQVGAIALDQAKLDAWQNLASPQCQLWKQNGGHRTGHADGKLARRRPGRRTNRIANHLRLIEQASRMAG